MPTPIPLARKPVPAPVRFGILGCGSIATHAIAPAMRWSPHCRLVAVSNRDAATAQRRARETQAERYYVGYQPLLDDPDIDAVYIGLPNGLHEEWTTKAAAAGKHVLCEKSLALTGAAATRMADACRTAGVLLMEAYMYRHHPQWDMIRDALRAGKIGEVALVRSGLAGRLEDTTDHRWSASLGGGALYDVTCYGINLARMIYGREPISVSALADTGTREKVDRTSACLMDFGYGRIAFASGSLSAFNHQFCSIEGTHGRITVQHPFIPGWDRTEVVFEHGMTIERVEVPGANHFLHQVEHFALCLMDTERPFSPAEDGVRNTLAVEAVEQSWLAGKPVEVVED